MSIKEIIALETGCYPMLILKNKFTMFVNHEAELAHKKVTFFDNLDERIFLSLECSPVSSMILVTTFNNVNFVRVIQNDDIKFQSDEDDLYYNNLITGKNEYSY